MRSFWSGFAEPPIFPALSATSIRGKLTRNANVGRKNSRVHEPRTASRNVSTRVDQKPPVAVFASRSADIFFQQRELSEKAMIGARLPIAAPPAVTPPPRPSPDARAPVSGPQSRSRPHARAHSLDPARAPSARPARRTPPPRSSASAWFSSNRRSQGETLPVPLDSPPRTETRRDGGYGSRRAGGGCARHEQPDRVRAAARRAEFRGQRRARAVRVAVQRVQEAAGSALPAADARDAHFGRAGDARDGVDSAAARPDQGRGQSVGELTAADAGRRQGRAAQASAGGASAFHRAQGVRHHLRARRGYPGRGQVARTLAVPVPVRHERHGELKRERSEHLRAARGVHR